MDPMKMDESVHQNKSLMKEGLITKVNGNKRKSFSRCVSKCLGLLSVLNLLLAGNIGQFFFCHIFIHPMSAEMIQAGAAERIVLESTLTNMTEDKDQLLEQYNFKKQERDQIQMTIQIQIRYSDLLKGFDELRREKDELDNKFSALESDKDQLQQSYENLTLSKNVLHDQYDSLMSDKEALQAGYDAVMKEKEQLQANYSNLVTVKDQSEQNFKKVRDDLTKERDQLQQSYNTLKQEKNNLQTQLSTMTRNRNDLQRDRDQLQTNYSSVVNARDVLQQKIDSMDRPCQSGWKKFGSRCFYVSEERRSWDNSKDYCVSQGAQLAIIDNKDKQAFINDLLKSKSFAWFGLSDSYWEGYFQWVDGNYIKTTAYWYDGQPDDWKGEEDCAEFWPNDRYGSWNDHKCLAEKIYVCEKTL